MDLNLFLQLMLGLVLAVFLMVLLVTNWRQMPLIVLPFIWYLPEQTSAGRLLENYMYMRWFSIVAIPLLGIIGLMRRRQFFRSLVPSSIFPWILLFVICALFSSITNGISWFETLGYLAVYLRYPLFFILLINIDIDEKTGRKIILMFLILLLIQVPEVLYRHFALGIRGDDISWSLGTWGTANLGVYSIYATCIILAHALNRRFTVWHILSVAAFFVFALLGEIKAIVIWLPVIVFVTLYFYPFQTRIKKYSTIITAAVVGVIFMRGFYLNWQHLHGRQLASIIRTTYFTLAGETEGEEKYSAYRLGILYRIIDELKEDRTNLLIGYGPGSSLVGNFFGKPGKITQIVAGTKDTPNQIASTLLDVGLVGLVAYYLLLLNFVLLWKNINHNHNDPNNKLVGILKIAYPGILFYYLIVGPMYHPIWRFDAASFLFYFISAELYRASKLANLTI